MVLARFKFQNMYNLNFVCVCCLEHKRAPWNGKLNYQKKYQFLLNAVVQGMTTYWDQNAYCLFKFLKNFVLLWHELMWSYQIASDQLRMYDANWQERKTKRINFIRQNFKNVLHGHRLYIVLFDTNQQNSLKGTRFYY